MPVAVIDEPFVIEARGAFDPRDLVQPQSDRTGGSGNDAQRQHLLRLLDGPVVSGTRKPKQFLARLIAQAGGDVACINAFAQLSVREADGERAVVLRCDASALTVGLITTLDDSGMPLRRGQVPPPTLVWSYTPRLADATARADLLGFLRLLHASATLRIEDDSGTSIGAMDVPGAPFVEDLERDWQFANDVATIEEWSGLVLPLPSDVSAHDVATVAQAAEIVRTRQIPLTYSGDVGAISSENVTAGKTANIEVEANIGITVFGYNVPLGSARARLKVRVVESVVDASRPGDYRLTLQPVQENAVVFSVAPPPGRLTLRRTLAPGEHPQDEDDTTLWTADWAESEREADADIRSGRVERFVDENLAFKQIAGGKPHPRSRG